MAQRRSTLGEPDWPVGSNSTIFENLESGPTFGRRQSVEEGLDFGPYYSLSLHPSEASVLKV